MTTSRNTSAARQSKDSRRLERETPWQVQRVGALVLGLILLVVATLAYAAMDYEASLGQSDSRWGLLAFTVVFGGVGVLLVYTYVHQSFAMQVPESIVEIERMPVRLGQTSRICITQPGPVRLKSLRANVVCLECKTMPGDTSPAERMVYQQNILDVSSQVIAEGSAMAQTIEFCLPTTEHVTGHDQCNSKLTYIWKIEVWGRVQAWPGFMHPFVIRVIEASRHEQG